MDYCLWVAYMVAAPLSTGLAGLAVIFAWKAWRAAKETADATKESVKSLDLSLKVDTILRLDQRFREPDLLRARVAVARAYLENTTPPDDLEDIFDFFDDIAHLLERGALDEKMAWHFFFAWLQHYLTAFGDILRARREREPAVWRAVGRLHGRVLAIEGHRQALSAEDLRTWFASEAALLAETPR